jgi:S1-C subfamily serine protease
MSELKNSFQVLQSLSDAIADVTENVSASVVRVSSARRSFGSGIIWSEDGYVITNNHVVGHAKTVEIGLQSGESLSAIVVGADPYADLALIKIEEPTKNLKAIEVGDSSNVRVGQFVLAVANPFGGSPAVVSGIITTSRRGAGGWFGRMMDNMIISDAPVNPGYSGGPLVDAQGRMIGVNTAYASGRALSIPVNTVKQIMERIKRDGRVKTGFLGVVLEEIQLPEEVASDVGQESGLMVLSVSRNTPAREAGVAMGDVLLQFNGKPIASHFELRKLLSEDVIGKTVKLSVLRGEKVVELRITPKDEQLSEE